ncbi:GTP cyclohydrolase II RibA [Methylobacterium sp. DB0501]|uniref:GTP cyclohydrolase II RibA n=1 Tax=Methylobacterium sp. DB0501 TaxID=2709665 RepID=UPI0013EDAA8D|nr:GTP cyclohydrolase II RibA [Methylobacterium sp. DB0501]NGM35599.1 GTP cyclohydrolase II RibA [Methylobacterium sp. DB0501]
MSVAMQSHLNLDPAAGREQVRDQIDVERALAEIRAGRPVALHGADPVLALSAEALDAGTTATLAALAGTGARLVLPAPRLRRLGLADRTEAGAVALPALDPARIETLSLRLDGRIDAPVAPVSPGDAAALALMALAQVLPAVIVVPGEAVPPGTLAVTPEAVFAYPARQAAGLRPVSRAPVPLASAPDSEFVVFRGGEGLRDQVAVVIGRPDLSAPVAVRLHSACLTGDLFGSLKCDCGDQLRGTAGWMAQHGGGIVLYLDQEGRGNGLANKIRAYYLQARGLDTYEADEALGFGLDQRRFDFAAAMLKALGVTAVRLVSNNPEKAASLEAAGLRVVETQRALGRVTPENIRYLTAKRDRAGHALELDAFACRDA